MIKNILAVASKGKPNIL